jgi:hypothetical protein
MPPQTRMLSFILIVGALPFYSWKQWTSECAWARSLFFRQVRFAQDFLFPQIWAYDIIPVCLVLIGAGLVMGCKSQSERESYSALILLLQAVILPILVVATILMIYFSERSCLNGSWTFSSIKWFIEYWMNYITLDLVLGGFLGIFYGLVIISIRPSVSKCYKFLNKLLDQDPSITYTN